MPEHVVVSQTQNKIKRMEREIMDKEANARQLDRSAAASSDAGNVLTGAVSDTEKNRW